MSLFGRAALMGRQAGGGAPFSPSDLSGLVAWWDASDTATITHSSNAVSQWNDKSGNGYHLVQSTGAAKPTTNTRTQNGLNCLDFDGGDVMTGSISLGLTNFTIVVVSGEDAAQLNKGLFTLHAGSGNDYVNGNSLTFETGTVSSGGASQIMDLACNNAFFTHSGSVNEATPIEAWVGVKSGTGATSLLCLKGSVAPGAGISCSAAGTATGVVMGSRYFGAESSGSRFNGPMCEVIVYNVAHTGTDRTNLISYAETRWGV
jgi:hypothetical protein